MTNFKQPTKARSGNFCHQFFHLLFWDLHTASNLAIRWRLHYCAEEELVRIGKEFPMFISQIFHDDREKFAHKIYLLGLACLYAQGICTHKISDSHKQNVSTNF